MGDGFDTIDMMGMKSWDMLVCYCRYDILRGSALKDLRDFIQSLYAKIIEIVDKIIW